MIVRMHHAPFAKKLRGKRTVKENTVLEMRNIHKSFPGVRALKGVDFTLCEGEIHALMGENGAGKSTLIKVLTGVYGKDEGQVYIKGQAQAVSIRSPQDAQKFGISTVYQEITLCPNLSVAENMYLGRLPKTQLGVVDWKKLYQDADEVLKKLGLKFDCRNKVKNLSVAESQMTEIAKCLTIGAKVIIMDEPTAALTDEEIQILFRIIAELKAKGISILYISHRMDEIFRISDRLTVFRDGKYIATKAIGETDYDDVVSMMVGRSVTNLYPKRNYEKQDVAMELRNVTGKGVHGVSLKLHKGEILGVAGLLGSGTIELSKIVYGALPMTDGEIIINGEKKDCSSPRKALKAGIGFVSDDRKQEGLVLIRNIRENISMSSLDKISNGLYLNKAKETENINAEVKRLNIKISSPAQLAGKLSGGNQQKVILARWLATDPEFLILDEPTRGIDIGTKTEIQKLVLDLADQGMAVTFISSEVEEMLRTCSRMAVLRDGQKVGELEENELSQSGVMKAIAGGDDK